MEHANGYTPAHHRHNEAALGRKDGAEDALRAIDLRRKGFKVETNMALAAIDKRYAKALAALPTEACTDYQRAYIETFDKVCAEWLSLGEKTAKHH